MDKKTTLPLFLPWKGSALGGPNLGETHPPTVQVLATRALTSLHPSLFTDIQLFWSNGPTKAQCHGMGATNSA